MSRVDCLVEGELDGIVAQRLLAAVNLTAGTIYGKKGWTYIKKNANGFARTRSPLFILVDFMDLKGFRCPGEVPAAWLNQPQSNVVFRVACSEIESWLLADRKQVAALLNVSINKIPTKPDTLSDPKQSLIDIARKSKNRRVRSELPPSAKLSASEGPYYTPFLSEFVQKHWNIQEAAQNSPSLKRCIFRLQQFRQMLGAS
jgi:hypothetical protein